ncbi:MAG TPA: MFS transporter [Allosphingosinicella sp.]|nr:MFS transporter [Allosphingosinicella sp.]
MTGREQASLIAVLSAMALVVLDAGLLTVALPSLARSMAVSPSAAVLAVSAYQVALVIGLLPSAHLAERLGYRALFVGGVALFSLASILCAAAPSLELLVAARVLQGLGGAAIMALGIALLRIALGPARLGAAIAWNAMNVALCAAAAPVLGAFILSVAPWPWLFLAKLPLAALALAASRALPRVAPTRRSVDLPGILLHASAAALALAAATTLPAQPFPAGLLAGLAALAATLLIKRERSRPEPIWPLDLLALRPFRVATAASICCFAGQSAGLLGLAFHLQTSAGHGPLMAGVVLACWPLAVAATAPVADRLARQFGSAALCSAGAGLLGAGLLLCALWPATAQAAPLALGAIMAGFGFGLFQVPNNRTLFLAASPERSATAGGLQGSARLLGQTLGSVLIGLLFSCIATPIAARMGLAVAALFAIIAAGVSALALPIRARDGAGRSGPEGELS